MTKFCDLVELMNASLIVVVENEFSCIDSYEKLLSEISLMNQSDMESLLNEIDPGNDALLTKVRDFSGEILELYESFEEFKMLVKTGDILTALEFQGATTTQLMGKDIVEELQKNKINDSVFEVSLKYGITNVPPAYEELFKEIKSFYPRKSFRCYSAVPQVEWDNINNEVRKLVAPEEFCIFIVDKKLGNNENEGQTFIENNLLKSSFEGINIVSILYTSYKRDITITTHNDYYKIEVNKEDPEALEHIAIGLSTCTYIHIFNKLKSLHKKSIDEAFEFAASRPHNMKYLTNMANTEGITSLEVINKWFATTKEYLLTKNLLEERFELSRYHYILGLTAILSEKFFGIIQSQSNFETEKEIFEVNVSEIFDYSINQIHLPPAPGDIYYYKNHYYILVGQDCDFIVRKNKSEIERKIKSADLLQCSFKAEVETEKVRYTNTHMKLNYFKSVSGEIGTLDIRLGSHINTDFRVLDLCTFNKEGLSSIALDRPLHDNIKRVLTHYWNMYHENLILYFKELVTINTLMKDNGKRIDILVKDDLDLIHTENLMDENQVDFPIKRVCRLKGNFRDLLLKSYWDYRGRIGLNNINVINYDQMKLSTIEYGYLGRELNQLNIDHNILVTLQGNRDKDKIIANRPIIFNLKDLEKGLDELAEANILNKEIEIGNDSVIDEMSKITFKKRFDSEKNCFIISVIYPYKILPHNGILHTKEEFNIYQILDTDSRKRMSSMKDKLADMEFSYIDNNEKRSLFDLKGKPKNLTINDLIRGIHVPMLQISVSLKDNVIIISSSNSK